MVSLKVFYKKYSSIDDLPMFYWDKIHSTGEYKYLFVKQVQTKNTKELEQLWTKIYDEYLLEFGLGKGYLEIKALKEKIAKLKGKYIITGDKLLKNHINVEENMLKSLYGENNKSTSFRESLVHLEKMQQIKIDTKKITVADYYNYLRSIKNNG